MLEHVKIPRVEEKDAQDLQNLGRLGLGTVTPQKRQNTITNSGFAFAATKRLGETAATAWPPVTENSSTTITTTEKKGGGWMIHNVRSRCIMLPQQRQPKRKE
jgi:hypothetical protein